MATRISRQRIYAGLLAVGSCVLLYRTVRMLAEGAFGVLVFWVFALLVAEFLIDLGCLLASVRWWIANDSSRDRLPLRLGAAAAILHALRVMVFVIGRVGPWIDFDVRPEQVALHHTRWNMGQVYFASVMSILGVIGVIVIWRTRRKAAQRPLD